MQWVSIAHSTDRPKPDEIVLVWVGGVAPGGMERITVGYPLFAVYCGGRFNINCSPTSESQMRPVTYWCRITNPYEKE